MAVPTTPAKPRLRVAATCSCGRRINQVAPRGKATVEVKCPRAECGKPVKLVAIPDAALTAPPATEPPADPPKQPRKVHRVTDYDRRPAPGPDPGPPVVPPASVPEPEPGQQPSDPPGPDHEPGRDPGPGRVRGWVDRRRAAKPPRESRHPYGELFPGL